MTPSTTHTADHHVTSLLEQRCSFYRSECRMLAAVDEQTQEILTPVGGLVGAVAMPRELGRHVQAGLRIRMLAGPVVDEADRWIFLTGPGHALDPMVHKELLRLGVSLAQPGDIIVLPSPRDEHRGLRRWESAPKTPATLPPQSAVIATTRAMALSTVR